MQDLVRSPLPLWGFRLARPVLARSYLTRHDGEASIRRGYTFLEMGRVTSQLPGVIVRHGFPFRMTVSRDKISRFQNPIP
jgi:hypothetical protein